MNKSFFLGLAGAAVLAAYAAPSYRTRVDIAANSSVTRDEEGFARFTGDDLRYLSLPGEPDLPYRVVTVLLPPDADLSSVRAAIDGTREARIPGLWEVRPAAPAAAWDGRRTAAVWPAGKRIVGGKDIAVYGRSARFPREFAGAVETGELRGWRIASVPVALFRCNAAEKSLFRLSGGRLRVESRKLRNADAPRRHPASDRLAVRRIKGLAANYDEAAPLYGSAEANGPAASASGYAIITTESIRDSLANLDAFVRDKEARGFTVYVVAEDEWGGGAGDTAAENLRSWLVANYSSLAIEYALLIGNPDPSSGDVPMKNCIPYSTCPTDFYYAELSGNWDRDGDGRYGEFGDLGSGGIDRAAEVYVGRIPCYSTADADAILGRILEYENEAAADISWREKALLPMVPSDGSTPGYQLGEEIKNYILSPAGWTCHRVYNSAYGLSPAPETTPNSVANTTAAWLSSQFGAVFWWTHGASKSASSVMNLTSAATLDDSHPGLTFQCSCTNAYPEATNNLAYTLLTHGCIGTVAATRVSYYTIGQASSYAGKPSNAGHTYEYAEGLVTAGQDCGTALHEAKRTITPTYSAYWQNHIVFNLYGDPALGLSTSMVDADSDGLRDYWETEYFGDLTRSPGADDDADGLTNLEEFGAGTDPASDDTDGDGLLDGDEVNTHGSDPCNADTDGDGLGDGDEIARGADPNDIDSDDDYLDDGEEVNDYGSDPAFADTDGDGYCDVIEVAGQSGPEEIASTPAEVRMNFQTWSGERVTGFAPATEGAYSASLRYGWL